MTIHELLPYRQDDLLDESTIELFRRYLEELVDAKNRPVSLSSWVDN